MSSIPVRICEGDQILEELTSPGQIFSMDKLLCGKFTPSLPGAPEYIHFQTIFYSGEIIILSPSGQIFKLLNPGFQTVEIVEPGKIYNSLNFY